MITVGGREIDEKDIEVAVAKLRAGAKGTELVEVAEAMLSALQDRYEVSTRPAWGLEGFRIVIEGTGPHADPAWVATARAFFVAVRSMGGQITNATLTHAPGEPSETAEGLDNAG